MGALPGVFLLAIVIPPVWGGELLIKGGLA